MHINESASATNLNESNGDLPRLHHRQQQFVGSLDDDTGELWNECLVLGGGQPAVLVAPQLRLNQRVRWHPAMSAW